MGTTVELGVGQLIHLFEKGGKDGRWKKQGEPSLETWGTRERSFEDRERAEV